MPQLRLGRDTTCAFNDDPVADEPLRENDVFFLDLGLLIDGHEADVGRTFVIGDFDDARAGVQASEEVFQEGRAHWLRTNCSGAELYRFAAQRASARGFSSRSTGRAGIGWAGLRVVARPVLALKLAHESPGWCSLALD